jgi:hypothetical protein
MDEPPLCIDPPLMCQDPPPMCIDPPPIPPPCMGAKDMTGTDASWGPYDIPPGCPGPAASRGFAARTKRVPEIRASKMFRFFISHLTVRAFTSSVFEEGSVSQPLSTCDPARAGPIRMWSPMLPVHSMSDETGRFITPGKETNPAFLSIPTANFTSSTRPAATKSTSSSRSRAARFASR